MTEREFYELVKKMREGQNTTFTTMPGNCTYLEWLLIAQDLEQRVDQAIEEYFDNNENRTNEN